MAIAGKAVARIRELLPGETVLLIEIAQLKPGGTARSVAGNVALSTAGAVISGVGMMRLSAPSPVYVVVTDVRTAVFLKGTGWPVGDLVADFPRATVELSERSGLLSTVYFTDRASGQALFRLNFGLRKSKSRAVVDAAA